MLVRCKIAGTLALSWQVAPAICACLFRTSDCTRVTESVTTSCECLSPAVVKYRTPASQTATAILLEYVDDSSHSSGVRKSVALDLAVVVTISLVDGRSCDFIVDLLHSHLVVEGER